MRVFSSKKLSWYQSQGIFSLFLLLIMKSYRSTMTDTQTNPAPLMVLSNLFRPILLLLFLPHLYLLIIIPIIQPFISLLSNVFKGVNEARPRVRRPKNAPRHSKKCELHGRRTPSTSRRSKGVEAYTFSVSGKDAYASQAGYLALKNMKKTKKKKT